MEKYTIPDLPSAAMVTAVHRDRYELWNKGKSFYGKLKTVNFYHTSETAEFPTVGDYVQINYNSSGDSLITEILPRRSVLMRLNATQGLPDQAVAANFDYVFIVMSLNQDFHPSKLERYLTVAWQSGALPVVILTKADLCEDKETYLSLLVSTAPGIEAFCISSVTGEGIYQMARFFEKGKTIVLLGSSGVGKSSLANCLMGKEEMLTGAIRTSDAQGRHTTTYRQCLFLPEHIRLPDGQTIIGGGCLIDTPGIRKLIVSEIEEGVQSSFTDIENLSASCRFRNCTHTSEPGCSILAALGNGSLDKRRWKNYLNIQREEKYARQREQILKMKQQRTSGKKNRNRFTP